MGLGGGVGMMMFFALAHTYHVIVFLEFVFTLEATR